MFIFSLRINGDRDIIPKSIQLVAGRTGQEFNQRKGRKGAFWEDRYHATAVETGEHLVQCLVYIDLNMVRAGVVNHPSEWAFGGYNEIQSPRERYALIDYEGLRGLFNFQNKADLGATYHGWIDKSLKQGPHFREEMWTESIAVRERGICQGYEGKAWFQGEGAQGCGRWLKLQTEGIASALRGHFWARK